jgi:competence protein ComEA
MIHWTTLLVALLFALLLVAPPVPAAPSENGAATSAGTATPGAAKSPRRTTDAKTGAVTRSAATTRATGDRVNINSADVKELMTLSGIGRTVAERIVEYRRAHGSFAKPEEVRKVEGVGAGVWERNRDRIVVK